MRADAVKFCMKLNLKNGRCYVFLFEMHFISHFHDVKVCKSYPHCIRKVFLEWFSHSLRVNNVCYSAKDFMSFWYFAGQVDMENQIRLNT